jgi:hypothetical protein
MHIRNSIFLLFLSSILALAGSDESNCQPSPTQYIVASAIGGSIAAIGVQSLEVHRELLELPDGMISTIAADQACRNLFAAGTYGLGMMEIDAKSFTILRRVEPRLQGMDYLGIVISPDDRNNFANVVGTARGRAPAPALIFDSESLGLIDSLDLNPDP